jgi:hypothetical protein
MSRSNKFCQIKNWVYRGGTEPGLCAGCGAVEPIRYMIFKSRAGETAQLAIGVPVHRPRQRALSAAAFLRAPEPEGLT